MRTSPTALLTLAALAGGVGLIAKGCPTTRIARRPGMMSVASLDAPVVGGSDLPRTWYCEPGWSNDAEAEHTGMERFAWRLFMAINWPGTVRDGTAWMADPELDGLNTPGTYPQWATWHTPKTLSEALKDCSKPSEPPLPNWTRARAAVKLWPQGPGFDIESLAGQGSLESNPPHPCVYDEHGDIVHYEIRVLQDGWASAVHNAVCGRQNVARSAPSAAPSALASAAPSVCPPSNEPPDKPQDAANFFRFGQCKPEGPVPDNASFIGAIAVKLAWKVLSPDEISSGRFLQRPAQVPSTCSQDGGNLRDVTLGLVAFHITQKTLRYGDWIWSTFEHVNNLERAEGASAASFFNPQCGDCLLNTTQKKVGGQCRTQIARTASIPTRVENLNDETRRWLARQKTVLQHYRLIDVQYVPYTSETRSPTPDQLRNPLMETYHVVGRARPGEDCGEEADCVKKPASCIGCHANAKLDYNFMVETELCNRKASETWIGCDKCARLGMPCTP